MTSRISDEAHSPVSNRGSETAAKRFYSTEPSFGHGGDRHPVDPGGFEAVPGYRPGQKADIVRPPARSITELTYKPQTGVLASPQAKIGDTSSYPWRVNAALKIAIPGSQETFWGTGWFIAPYAVITAAHAVYPREPGGYTGWASQIEVVPALNGGAPPFGSVVSSLFYCPTGWQSAGDVRVDYGVILLNHGLGSTLGTFGYATYSDADIAPAIANLAGYPVTPPDGSGYGTQWYAAGHVSNVDDSFIYYELSTQAGESGGCVYRNIGDQSYAMGIHTAAMGGTDRALRIIDPVYQNLQQWAAMKG